ncbi:hypothetical protein [Sphingopyxis sp. GW247-27LB]|uniref:hypothetical protein n=1 Tax=Sphingopyxis sp. GW247-27LB TaxID=2012632 RepID=UPI000BA6736C|nr:hypothetical protein [Sphingopyxis sp. GW247-27LB]PAL23570.1 hypothetical protein CD928_05750 [Sphingopyxis sp. GW247-27LB]
MTHPKVLAMAREIAASVLPAHSKDEVGRAIINGGHDGWYGVQSAIAAIERTTRLAADYVGEWCDADSSFDHLPEPEGGSNA